VSVALFASAFYPHVGGVEELCRQLAHAYKDKGVSAVILTNRWPRSLPAYEEFEGIPVYRLPFRIPEGSLKAHVSYQLTHGRIRRQVLRVLARHAARVLHVQCVSSNGYYALLAKRATGLPLVVSAQGEVTMDAGGLYQKSPFANRVLRQLLAQADRVTACSRHALNDLERHVGVQLGNRGAVIYNGVRLADFDGAVSFPHPRPYVLAIGRLVPQKGMDLLIRGFGASGITSHDLLIAGEGPERPALQAVADSMGVTGRVTFVGRADRPTAIALFRGCSYFVLPSRIEPLGIVNLEAMAAGKAVIASRVGGVPEIVQEGVTGLLVDPTDVDALARAIARLGTDQQLRGSLGAAGRLRAQRFDWRAIAEQYLLHYPRGGWQGTAAPEVSRAKENGGDGPDAASL
jgi:glycogen(starch) synthase